MKAQVIYNQKAQALRNSRAQVVYDQKAQPLCDSRAQVIYNQKAQALCNSKAQVIYDQVDQKIVSVDLLASRKIGPQGLKGDSAYEIAKKNGFQGTEEQWLLSLKGEPGQDYILTEVDKDEIADIAIDKIDIEKYALKDEIPTNNIQLINGAGYQNVAQVENAITAKGYQTSAQVESAIAEKGYQTSSQVESAIASKGYQTAEQVDHVITQKGYQTSAQVESAITQKGYQTASQVENKIESYGYQDATDVENKVESYGYQTAQDVESKVEGYGYQTESDVATKVESYGYQTAADVDAVLPKKVSDLTNDAEYTTKQYVDDEIAGITIEVDPTLSQQGKAADAKAVGDAVSRIDGELDSKQDALDFGTPTSADVGKALMPKTIENGEVTEWEFGEAGKVDDVQVNGVSVLNNKVANVPIAGYNNLGVVKPNTAYGTGILNDGTIGLVSAGASDIKEGTTNNIPIMPARQHIATFYGLAKAAGHNEKNSSLPVGQYTTEAKSAIKTMLDIPTNNNQLTNGAGYQTALDVEAYGYQTASEVDDAIQDAIGDITGITYYVCQDDEFDPDTLVPTIQGESGVVYLVPRTDAIAGSAVVGQTDLDEVEENNVYLEFIYIDGDFEKIGAIGDINLDGYVTDDDIATDASVQAMLDEIGL